MSSRYARTTALAVPLAVLTALVCLVAAGQLEQAQPGLPDAGALVRLGLPVTRTLQDLSAALTVGLLVLAAFVLPPSSAKVKNQLAGHRARAVRFAAVASTCWLLAGSLTLVLTYADVAGLAPTAPGFASQLGYFMRSFDLGRSMVASLVLAAMVSIGTMLATRMNTAGWLAVLSVVALLPLALSGHAAGSDDHQAAVDSLGAHLVGVSVWVGGLAAVVLLSPWVGDTLPVTVRRYSTLAGGCFVVVALSGLVNAWLRLGSWSGLASAYGALVLVKTAALATLGLAGWWHRRRLLGALTDGPAGRRAFLRLATGEVLVMAATIGVAVALSRSAPPVSQTTVPAGEAVRALLGYPFPPPLTAARLLTSWYLEPVWASIAVLALGWYLVAVRRLRRRGDSWPLGRTMTWSAGCVLLLWTTSGGPAVYGRVQFSAHMIQHMTLMMVTPMLLVVGTPVTLALRTLVPRQDGSRGPREWLLAAIHSRALRLLAHPLVAAGLFLGSLVVFYYTPLLGAALSTHTGHMMMTAHFLAIGYLFAWVIMGTDPGPARAAYPVRLLVLLVTVSAHAFFGIGIIATSTVMAPDWWASIGLRDTAALLADQHTGGGIAWGLAEVPTIVMAVIVAVLWSRSDDREARRTDRQADRDGDADLVAYNRFLASMASTEERAARSDAPD
jgi:cytochrome c oxidase assembly factor CtaG